MPPRNNNNGGATQGLQSRPEGGAAEDMRSLAVVMDRAPQILRGALALYQHLFSLDDPSGRREVAGASRPDEIHQRRAEPAVWKSS